MRIWLVALLALVLAGCGTFHAAAPHVVLGIQEHKIEPSSYTLVGPVRGSECGFSVLYLIHVDPASAMEAYESARESKGADFILEPRTEVAVSNYVLFQNFCVHVWGLGAKLK